MSELILIDQSSGVEIGRRPMAPQERYEFYRECSEHELMTYDAKAYTMHTVAWLVPEENCIVSVTYHGWAPLACGCMAGTCTCGGVLV